MRQASHTDNDQAPQPEPVAALTPTEKIRQLAEQQRGEAPEAGSAQERITRARNELRRRQRQAKQVKEAEETKMSPSEWRPGPERRGPSL